MVVQAVRSLVFYALFIGQTVVLAIIVAVIALIDRRRTGTGLAVGRYWGHINIFLLRWVVGIRTRVDGGENVPEGPCIIAAKHQSDWDIFAILPFARRPAFIAKKQLMDIPVFGHAARSVDTITIDRSLGAQAIPRMLEDGRRAVERGCQIIIFPEGTRRAPLDPPDYRQGILRMYEALGVPVVPVALNSGLFWGRNSLILWPGTARARFLAPIPPGLDAATFKARLVEAVETGSNRLIAEAVDRGVARPVPPEWRARLAALGFPTVRDGD